MGEFNAKFKKKKIKSLIIAIIIIVYASINCKKSDRINQDTDKAFFLGQLVKSVTSQNSTPATIWNRSDLSGQTINSIIFAFNKFWTVGDRSIAFSENGKSWTNVFNVPSGFVFYDIKFINNTLIAVGGKIDIADSAAVYTSTNGTTWSKVSNTILNVRFFTSISGNSSLYVATGYNSFPYILISTSTDLVNWSNVTDIWNSNFNYTDISLRPFNLFTQNGAGYILGDSGNINSCSSNCSLPANWSIIADSGIGSYRGIVEKNGVVIAFADVAGTDPTSSHLFKATSGSALAKITTTNCLVKGLQVLDGRFVAVCPPVDNTSYFYSSEDGLTWQSSKGKPSGLFSSPLTKIIQGNNFYFGISNGGNYYSSSPISY